MNMLKLCYGTNETIGTLEFNMAQYIGKQPVLEKALI